MSNVLSIWRDSSKRSRGVFAGCVGLASVLFTLAPVWDNPADAAITDFDYGPFAGVAGTAVGFSVPECVENGLGAGVPDVAFEINTATVDNPETVGVNEAARDQQGFALQADGVYGDDGAGDPPYVAPPEYDFLEPPASEEGPAYDVTVACFTADGADEGSDLDFSLVTVPGGFVYPREATTSSTAATTSSTAATTSSTAATTSSTAATTSSTAATTSSTSSSTTSTTAGSTSSSSTTSSVPECTTPTTNPGDPTTTSTVCVTTTSSSTTSTTTDGSTSSSAPSSTTTTIVGDTTSTSAGATSTTAAPACTVADVTLTNGQPVGVSCGGYAPASTVAVDLLSTPVRIGTLTANASGQVTGTVTIPLNTTAGSHTVRFTGTAPDGSTLVRTVAVSVSRELPRTGDETWTMLRYALLLMGVGLVAVGRSQIVAANR